MRRVSALLALAACTLSAWMPSHVAAQRVRPLHVVGQPPDPLYVQDRSLQEVQGGSDVAQTRTLDGEESDLVENLPGLEAGSKIVQHAGRIALDSSERDNLFYWHFVASEAPETAPLVIWLNGGPGCSSMQGLFLGISPFTLVDDAKIKINPHSWHHTANMLFLDQPVGTGMSYTKRNTYRTDEATLAQDFHEFLVKFMKRHPEYLTSETGSSSDEGDDDGSAQVQTSRPVYIFGESHAGRYIPQFSDYILKQNTRNDSAVRIQLAGVGIGNGWVHPMIQYDYSEFAHGVGLLTYGQVRSLKASYADCRDSLLDGNFYTPSCFDNMNLILNAARNGLKHQDLNFYDIREYVRDVRAYPTEQAAIVRYLNRPAVRKAVHANLQKNFRFDICSDGVYRGLKNFDGVSTLANVQSMLNQGLRVLFYNGQWDMMCNHFGTEKLLLTMDWAHADDYRDAKKYTWNVDGKRDPAGFAQQGGNLTYLVVANAGHMVPYNAPDAAADMLRRFVTAQAFDSDLQGVANMKTNASELESFQCYVTPQDTADSVVTVYNTLSGTSTSSTASTALSATWLYVVVVIAVMSSALSAVVTVMCMRSKRGRLSGHTVILQDEDEDDEAALAAEEDDANAMDDAQESSSDDEVSRISIRARSPTEDRD